MAVYKCSVCGMIFDEEKEGKKIEELPCCPICRQPVSKFEKVIDSNETEPHSVLEDKKDLAYDSRYVRTDKTSRYMKRFMRWQ